MFSKRAKIITTAILTPLAFISVYFPALAGSIVPEEGKSTGRYDFNSLVTVAVNVSSWILGIVGSLALLMFIYGGFLMLISGGGGKSGDGKNKVNEGKEAIKNAIIGLVIVFAAYLIIQFVLTALGVEGTGKGFWAETGWFKKEN